MFERPLPTILVFVILASTVLGTGEAANAASIASGLPDANRLLRVLINFGIFFVSVGGILADSRRWTNSGPGIKWMLIYALFALASTLWSVSPIISLWKSFEVLNFVLLAIYLSGYLRTAEDLRWLMNIVCIGGLYLMMTVYAGILIHPNEALLGAGSLTGRGYLMVRGLVPIINPSTVGVFAAIIAIYLLTPLLMQPTSSLKHRIHIGYWIVVAIAIGLLLMSRSRTQMIAFMIAFVTVLIFSRRYILATTLAGVGTLTLVISEVVINYLLRGQTYDQFAAFTGRLAWWEEAVDLGMADAPWIGRGFYAAQKVVFNTNVLDSTYVEVFFGLGLVGLTLLLIPLLIMMLTFLRGRPRSGRYDLIDVAWMQGFAIFVVLMVRSITVSTFVSMHAMLLYYVVIQIVAASALRIRLRPLTTHAPATAEPTRSKPPRLWQKQTTRQAREASDASSEYK